MLLTGLLRPQRPRRALWWPLTNPTPRPDSFLAGSEPGFRELNRSAPWTHRMGVRAPNRLCLGAGELLLVSGEPELCLRVRERTMHPLLLLSSELDKCRFCRHGGKRNQDSDFFHRRQTDYRLLLRIHFKSVEGSRDQSLRRPALKSLDTVLPPSHCAGPHVSGRE